LSPLKKNPHEVEATIFQRKYSFSLLLSPLFQTLEIHLGLVNLTWLGETILRMEEGRIKKNGGGGEFN
jgi:hypothetical protein